VLAVGVEPQVLSGDKRGPSGTGSEPIGMEVKSFEGLEQVTETEGWKSDAFDF